MNRYFFHISAGSSVSLDSIGILLPDMAEAGMEAMKMVSRIIHAHPKEPAEIWEGWSIEVIDGDGAPVFTLPFENVLRRKANGSGERVSRSGKTD
jgi:uncharacterized protein DUF6894